MSQVTCEYPISLQWQILSANTVASDHKTRKK